jgi:excisionase family DNA binding protein
MARPESTGKRGAISPKWISVGTFCEIYGVSRQTAYDLIHAGSIQSALIRGTMRRINVASADRLFAASSEKVEAAQ